MAMKLEDCIFDGSRPFKIGEFPTSSKADKSLRSEIDERIAENRERMMELQNRLYADGREGVVIMLQAMDAAGKDSAIKNVMGGVNPQGVRVYSFKQPSKEELAHDYLWRAVCHLPERGEIGLFNRSYYEDVLIVRVRDMRKGYKMPKRTVDMPEEEFFDKRFRQIRDFEEYLYENGYRLLKIFLNVSLDEQKKRFLERIDDPAKNWKFSAGDLDERDLWPQYMKAFEDAIDKTSTKHAPWYVIPADQKWYARWLISEAVVKVLNDCNPQYPELNDAQKEELVVCRERLMNE